MPEISGRARHSCARHRFGGQGTARPTCAGRRGVVEAVVSTASNEFSTRLCQTPGRSQNGAAGTLATQTGRPEAERAGANESNALQDRRYGAMRSVSVSV